MFSDFIQVVRSKALLSETDPTLLKSKLKSECEETSIEMDKQDLTAEAKVLGVDHRYKWEINKSDDGYVLTEYRYVDGSWLGLFLVSIFVAATGFVMLALHSSSLISGLGLFYIGSFSLLGSVTVMLFLVSTLGDQPGLVPKLRGVTEGHTTHYLYGLPIMIVLCSFMIWLVGSEFFDTLPDGVGALVLYSLFVGLIYNRELFQVPPELQPPVGEVSPLLILKSVGSENRSNSEENAK